MGFLREPSHLLLVALVVIVLFGSRRLPDAARGLGRSMRIFKAEVKQMREDDQPPAERRAEPPLEGRVVPNGTQPTGTGQPAGTPSDEARREG